jgi:hypothetical protein
MILFDKEKVVNANAALSHCFLFELPRLSGIIRRAIKEIVSILSYPDRGRQVKINETHKRILRYKTR